MITGLLNLSSVALHQKAASEVGCYYLQCREASVDVAAHAVVILWQSRL